jgi:hypothetical protein
MQELEAGEPAELEIQAPPGLLPNLNEWGIEEVERGVCDDTYENRKIIRQHKGRFNVVFDTNGQPTAFIQVVTAEMYNMAQGLSKSDLLADPDDYNSDYLSGVKLILAENAKHLAPTWVLNTTKTYIRQQERKRDLGPDAALLQSRLVTVPHRCNAMKTDGTRCWGWSDGSTDTAGYCRVHARRINKTVESTLGMTTAQIMRNRMLSGATGMLDKLEALADSEDERIALTAVRDYLDRAGFKAVEHVEQKVEVTVTDAAEEVKKRLAKLRQGQEEKAKIFQQIRDQQALARGEGEPVDAEVVEDDE